MMIHPNVNHIGGAMTDGFRYQGFIAGADYEDSNAMLDWLAHASSAFASGRGTSTTTGGSGRARCASATSTSGSRDTIPDTGSRRATVPEQYQLVLVDDVDAHHRRVTAAGVHADPPADQDYGMRTYHVTDPEGYHWGFMQRLGTPYVQRIPTEEGGWKEILADTPD